MGPLCVALGRSWGLCWRSWAALEPYVGGLGLLLGPMWPKNAKNMATLKMLLFLERERDLRPLGRSWAAFGRSVGGLGPLLGPMLPVLDRSWGLCSRSRGLCWRSRAVVGSKGPKPEREGDQARKPTRCCHLKRLNLPKPPTDFLYIYIYIYTVYRHTYT